MQPLPANDDLKTHSAAASVGLNIFCALLSASAALQLTRLCMNHTLQRTALAVVQHRGAGFGARCGQRESARASAFLRRQTDQGLRHGRGTARPQAEGQGGGKNGNKTGRRQ